MHIIDIFGMLFTRKALMLWERKKGFCLLPETIRAAPSYAWRERKDGGPKKENTHVAARFLVS